MRLRKSTQILLNGMLALALILSFFPPFAQTAVAISPDLVISQVYGGGGNSGATYTHDFIEIFNRGTAPASLAGMSLQYASATGTGNFGSSSTQLTPLPDVTIQPGQYFLVQEAQGSGGTTPLPTPDVVDATPIAMSATGGKVVLARTQATLGCNGGSNPCSPEQLALIVDLVGWDGANFYETAPAPATTNTTAILRLSGGCTETDNNAADFVAGAPTPRNTASPFNVCGGPAMPVLSCPATLSTFEGFAASVNVSASDADSIVTSISLDTIDPIPASGTFTLSNFVPAAAVGETATATVNASADLPSGSYLLSLSAVTDDGQTATCTITANIQSILPIGTVQGSVSDTADGRRHASPYSGQTVYVQAVITQKMQSRTSAGVVNYGIFIQNTAETADGDPNSSDGIFVFMNRFQDLIGGYVPVVGDEIILSGRVSEYFNMTQISSATMRLLVRSGVDIDAETPAIEADPPDDDWDAGRYWERIEGMRVQVPAGSIVLDGRDVFASTYDGEVWLARGDSWVAQQADPYARRAFRDAHPLDDDPALFDNNNGYRILVGSMGLKATLNDSTALVAPARTYDTVNNAPSGGLYYSFSKYQIMIEEQLDLTQGVDPALNNPVQAFDRAEEYSVVTFNMENLYDYRDDPFDGCDFAGNPGCVGVSPPFDYVPASEEAYLTRLYDIAEQIVTDMHSPDIIMTQEIEDQDICTLSGDMVVCGTTNNADGSPDPLQDLAVAILSLGGPLYDSAYDRDGADDRGIVSAYLFRSDRVEVLPADMDHPVLGSMPTVEYRADGLAYNYDVQNPKAFNAVLPADVDRSTGTDGSNVFTRPPQVGFFRIWRDMIGYSVFTDVYLLDNHFSSTPTARVGQRTEQALYNAAIVDALEMAFGDPRVVVGGDLNVYPRPDDPFFPGDLLFPSDQLGPLYDQGLTNLWDVMVADVPVAAFSYNFQGQTQTLDQLFNNTKMLDDLIQVRAAHINADFPADYDGDGARGTSDHDPSVARFTALPDLERLMDLVVYYQMSGDITGRVTARILLFHLKQAGLLLERGDLQGYMDQLTAFINQTRGFTPVFIDQLASDALVYEAQLLLGMGGSVSSLTIIDNSANQ